MKVKKNLAPCPEQQPFVLSRTLKPYKDIAAGHTVSMKGDLDLIGIPVFRVVRSIIPDRYGACTILAFRN